MPEPRSPHVTTWQHPQIGCVAELDNSKENSLCGSHFVKNECIMQVVSQREPLYVRISNILREYNQSNIIQEYIQNADDAKASRIVCAVDHRKLKNSSLLKHCAEEGALLIYNDSLFT
jgi:hypothetical protein